MTQKHAVIATQQHVIVVHWMNDLRNFLVFFVANKPRRRQGMYVCTDDAASSRL